MPLCRGQGQRLRRRGVDGEYRDRTSSIVTEAWMLSAMSSHEAFRSGRKSSHIPTAYTSVILVLDSVPTLFTSPCRHICDAAHPVLGYDTRVGASASGVEELADDIIPHGLLLRLKWLFLITHSHQASPTDRYIPGDVSASTVGTADSSRMLCCAVRPHHLCTT